MYNIPLSNTVSSFHKATSADITHVWRIVYHAYSAYIPLLGRTPPTFFEDFDSHIAKGNLWLLDQDEPAAMVVLTPNSEYVTIQALCVDPRCQGKGLGRTALQFAEAYTESLGINELRLYTNSLMERNIRIYSQWGFNETHRESYPWGERVHMHKLLTRSTDFIMPLGVSSLEVA